MIHEIKLPSPGTSASIWLVLDLTYTQTISTNKSKVNYVAYLERRNTSGTGAYSNGASVKSLVIGGVTMFNTTTTWDFRHSSGMNYVGARIYLGAGSYEFEHNSAGVLSLAYNLTFDDASNIIGDGSVTGTLYLPDIPRASTPTFSASPATAGTAVTINTNRASSGFTHTIEYNFAGTGWVTIGTGIGASTTWTPAASLFTASPNSATANAQIRTTTYNGGVQIGTPTTVNLPITLASTVKPSFSAITHSEANSAVSTKVGKYVQGLSKLNLALTSPSGVHGSTIASSSIQVAGQTINASSGTTPSAIAASGTVVITGTVVDSRARSYSATQNISVLAYTPPTVYSCVVERSTSLGVPDEDGSSIRVALNAAVSSLLNTTERNKIYVTVKVRERGTTTPWSGIAPVNSFNGGTGVIAYNSAFVLAGTYDVEEAWEVLVEVKDEFSDPVPTVATVATGAIFMHWGGRDEGLGVGKYWEQGGLDVLGQIYQNDGKAVIDTTNAATVSIKGIVELATVAEAETGTDTSRAVTPQGAAAVAALVAKRCVPSSVTVGSGTATVGADGRVILTDVSSVILNGVFDGVNSDDYEIRMYLQTSVGTAIRFAYTSSGSIAGGSNYHYIREAARLDGSTQQNIVATSVSQTNNLLTYDSIYTRFNAVMQLSNPGVARHTVATWLCGQHGPTPATSVHHAVVSASSVVSADTTVDGFQMNSEGTATMTGWIKVVKRA